MKNWIIGAVLVLAAAAAYYYFKVYQPAGAEQPVTAPVVMVEPVKEPEKLSEKSDSEPVPEPVSQPEMSTEVEEISLPMLAESDPVVLESLGGLLGEPATARFVVGDNVISRVVATIDMLGGRQVSSVVLAVQGPESGFAVTVNDYPETVINDEAGDPIPQFFIDPSNYARYTPYVEMLEAADPAELIENYRNLYPLLQEAYTQMGYADGDFNARLAVIIDELLATPEVTGPVNLIKPEAVFLFADPDLESLSAGQKIVLRMGSENANRVKSKLAVIRAGL
jgi:hypothetical protein